MKRSFALLTALQENRSFSEWLDLAKSLARRSLWNSGLLEGTHLYGDASEPSFDSHRACRFPVYFHPGAGEVLSFDAMVPFQHSANWRQVIENNFSVWTPFKSDEVLFRFRTVKAGENTRISVEYCPKEILDNIKGSAALHGAQVDALMLPSFHDQPCLIEMKQFLFGLARRNHRNLAIVSIAVLAVLAMGLELSRKEQARAAQEAAIGASARSLRALESPVDSYLLRESGRGIGKTHNPGLAFTSLAAIQSVLPPEAAVVSVTFSGRQLQLVLPSQHRAAVEGLKVDGFDVSLEAHLALGETRVTLRPGAGQ